MYNIYTKKKKISNSDSHNTKTLDKFHEEKLNTFHKNENCVIPKLFSQKEKLKQKLKSKNTNFEKQMNIIEQINKINSEIKTIKHEKNNYLLDNSKYIFSYFEDKKNISNNIPSINDTGKNNIVNNFFNIKTKTTTSDDIKDVVSFKSTDESAYEYHTDDNYIEKYFNNTNNTILNLNTFVYATDICQYCHKGELIHIEDEGILLCNICSRNIPYIFENEKPSYKEPPKEVCFYAYKRINHFKEILSQFQGKETTQIPEFVIEKIKLQMKKERLTLNQLTNKKTKDILKKLGFNKFYEHITFIKSKLGIKPPVMSNDLEDKLCNLFTEIQTPYSKFCPNNRVNFLNYYYTVYKLCELLDKTEFLDLLPMLKDREKIIEQDFIWKNICEHLDWKFMPTI